MNYRTIKRVLPLYIKFFFLVGTVYLIWTVPRSLITDREITLLDLLNSFLIFGLGMSLTLVSYHLYSIKDLGKRNDINLKNVGSYQQHKVNSRITPEILLQRLKRFTYFEKATLDTNLNKINFKTGFNGKSWGDQIEIQYQKEKDHYRYQIISKPRYFFTLLDFGQNLENVLRIESMLDPTS